VTKLSEVYVDETILQVGLTGQSHRAAAVATPAVESARLSMPGNFLRVWFKELANGNRFNLPFQKSDTIKTAKEAVMKHFGLDSIEFITRLFRGKPLVDAFIIGRIRLGDSDISVYANDLNAVFLVTGKPKRGAPASVKATLTPAPAAAEPAIEAPPAEVKAPEEAIPLPLPLMICHATGGLRPFGKFQNFRSRIDNC
jgi:hypothetical protein